MNKLIFAVMLGIAQNCAMASDASAQLDKLGATLRYLRAMPTGAKSALRCPSNLEKLHGVSMATAIATLGEPDFVEAGRYSYFLSSPRSPGQRGGGYPEITFFTTKAGIVDRVACVYAR